MMTSGFEIYGKEWCAYCNRAKTLLENKGYIYSYWDIEDDPEKHQEMSERTEGARTVPQIFYNGSYIGGFDQLKEYLKSV